MPPPPPPPPPPLRVVSSLDRDPYPKRFSAHPDEDPSLWPPVWDKTQELVILLRSIRGLHFFLLRPLLYLALCMDQQLRSADNKQLLLPRGLRQPASKCQSYTASLSLAGDVTSSVELADEYPIAPCSLMKRPRTQAENFPTTMSINHSKKVEENLFFSRSQLTRVKLCPSTQLHKNTEVIHIANQKSLLRYSVTFYLLSTHPSPFLTAPVSYCVPHIRHFMTSSSSTAFLESK